MSTDDGAAVQTDVNRLHRSWHRSVVFNSGRLALSLCLAAAMAAQTTSSTDLTQISIEDLMKLDVSSVSRKDQQLSKVPSSVYVITSSDIRHSGATNIPDLLRMVPGVDVARINANAWAISIRGFNSRYSGKVLVLIDGRTIYSPAYSGVYWDQLGVPLENIDRIEVIRGPGGTVWGANAMNGVINIITKTARETQGGQAAAVTGSYDRAQGLVEYGGPAGSDGAYRAYARYTMNTSSPPVSGSSAVDAGHSSQMGFRADWSLSKQDNVTLQGDALGNSEAQPITTLLPNNLPNIYALNEDVQVGAEDIVGRWSHSFSDGSEAILQLYYNRYRRFDQGLNVENTGDADFHYHFHAGPRNDIVTGIDFRVSDQVFTNGSEIALGSGHRLDYLSSAFLQDEVRISGSLAFTIGSKIEHNSYTGFEFEPSLQLAWSPSDRQTLWFSVSKAIEQPSWIYTAAQVDFGSIPLNGGGFAVEHISGNPLETSPRMIHYELGYRREIARNLTVDSSVFYSDYDSLQTYEPEAPYFTSTPAPPHLVIPSQYENLGNAHDFGVEFYARWRPTARWTISPGFSFLHQHYFLDPGSQDTTFAASAGDNPKFQAQVRSSLRLPRNLEWDISAYYVDSLINGLTGTGTVPAYTRVDSSLSWRIGEKTDVSVGGQNLLTARNLEFLDGSLILMPTEVGRAAVARVNWHF